MKVLLRTALAAAAVAALTVLAAPASASTSQPYHATFVEVGGAIPGGSCGSATGLADLILVPRRSPCLEGVVDVLQQGQPLCLSQLSELAD